MLSQAIHQQQPQTYSFPSEGAPAPQQQLDDGQLHGQYQDGIPSSALQPGVSDRNESGDLNPSDEVDSGIAAQSSPSREEDDGGQGSGDAAPHARPAPLRKNSSGHPVRKRTSRACDQCNQLRTKCDGKHPCSHCTETGLKCEYARLPKKRGKVSKKDLARQAAQREKVLHEEALLRTRSHSSGSAACTDSGSTSHGGGGGGSNAASDPTSQPRQLAHPIQEAYSASMQPSNVEPRSRGSSLTGRSLGAEEQVLPGGIEGHYQGMDLNTFDGIPPPPLNPAQPPQIDYRSAEIDFSNLYMGMGGLPGQPLPLEGIEFGLNSPSAATSTSGGRYQNPHVRHPVLLPLLPFLKNIMTVSLANELLEHFFFSASSEYPHPASPYHITAVFREKSFLGSQNPRRCSPAMLASMLWSAAWTSDARALTSPPSARARMCQKLLNLCIFLLNPLVHGERLGKGSPDAERNGVSKAHPMGVQEMSASDDVPVKISSGTIDDVVTYMHIAIVISSSEDKGASLRWWTAAWNLAKELRLGRELDQHARSSRPDSYYLNDASTSQPEDEMVLDQPSSDYVTDEEREERRRVWWLLYLVDRHLALCYNRHLTILDIDCVGLLNPMDEHAWQEGNFEPLDSRYGRFDPRGAGPFEFTGPSIFGYFLPISRILGEIVDNHQRRMHPLLQSAPSTHDRLSAYDAEFGAIITEQLDAFYKSMMLYRERHIGPADRNTSRSSGQSLHQQRQQLNETQYQIETACAYGTHLMHVMHILLHDRWDPVTLLDDEDMWISSSSFGSAMGHAISGADALAEVLGLDPEVGFMPYLFGIYLLQGSFLLLLTADKLGTEASDKVVHACETVVRAHEACITTLTTEYQRSFRKVMQSALAQVRGRMPKDGGEQQRRRREILSLYRWKDDGGGLAV